MLSLLTSEQRHNLMKQAMIAEKAGDMAKIGEILRQIPVSATLIMNLKKAVGPDVMRNLDLNYEEAEARYGPDWLYR
jgi:hypothetical protein